MVNEPKIDVNKELARSDYGSVEEEQAVSETSETSETSGTSETSETRENTISAERLSELESMAAQYADSEDRDLVDEVASGAYFDKHTKLYVPVRGKGEVWFSLVLPCSYNTVGGG